RRVLDFDSAKVAHLEVKRGDDNFTLTRSTDEWHLILPNFRSTFVVADKTKVSQLIDELGRLEAVEYINDAPSASDLAHAGLDKPEVTANIAFSDPATKPQTVLVGKQRENKP